MSRTSTFAVVFVALVFGAGSAAADSPFTIETKGGMISSTFTGDADGAESKYGFAAAIGIYRNLNPWLSVGVEPGYVMKGTSFGTVTDPTFGSTTYIGTFEYLYAADYLELPVMLRAKTGGNIRPVFTAGPVVGWKMVEKARLHSSADGDYEAEGTALKAIDFAASGGLGFEFGPADRCLTLDARYTTSITNNMKDEFGGELKNQDFRITLGWRSMWKAGF
jgi:hypothetical protein